MKLVVRNPDCLKVFSTSGKSSNKIPDVITIPSGFKYKLIEGTKLTIICAVMLATMTSYLNVVSRSSKTPVFIVIFSETPFICILFKAESVAFSSISIPKEDCAPNLTAAIERIPDPEPISSTALADKSCLDSSSQHILVVGWCPVPNVIPGSKFITVRLSLSDNSCQTGLITSLSSIGNIEK